MMLRSQRLGRRWPWSFFLWVSSGTSMMLFFGFIFPCVADDVSADDVSSSFASSSMIPEQFASPFGSYPNFYCISDDDRQNFHPVVRFPNNHRTISVTDNTKSASLASSEDLEQARMRNKWWRLWSKRIWYSVITAVTLGKRQPGYNPESSEWSIGKYDENRLEMYVSEHFQDTSNTIDGYGGQRTVHLGVDLGAPAGTKVYAFCDGVIHSAGYNAAFGDYGNVVVIEHKLPPPVNSCECVGSNRSTWALYGHLDARSIRGKRPGKIVKKGQVIGRVGDCHENGGWKQPHLHFQLSRKGPSTHDMPGAASVEDREKALMDYMDPRYILGPVH